MPLDSRPVGRRERNKQEKLERITAAARDLFAERGVDEVTTQEIADQADIGTGTLFLYAKTKGELLLLVQNSTYADALAQGRSAAASIPDVLDAVMAIIRPVVECNRKQVDNGRTYLREIVFGDPEEPHHRRRRRDPRARRLRDHVRQHGGDDQPRQARRRRRPGDQGPGPGAAQALVSGSGP